MMTDAERIRMGLTAAAGYPPPPHHAHTPGLYGPPTASPSSLLGAAKPPTGLPGGPPLGYPPGFPPGFGAAVSAASISEWARPTCTTISTSASSRRCTGKQFLPPSS